MQQFPLSRHFLLREVFNLIKAKALYYETVRYSTSNLVSVLQKITDRKYRSVIQKINTFNVTSQLGVALTQSVLNIFYSLDNKIKATQQDALLKILTYSKMRKVILDLHQPATIPWYNSPEDSKIIFLNQRKIIGAMKLLNMFRKVSVYDWKTIKTFRKWQLEDLRSLMDGYRRTNCALFINMRNTCLYSVMKKVDYLLKSDLREGLFKLKNHYEDLKYRQQRQLVKLNEILLRKRILGKLFSNEDLQKKIAIRRFLSNLTQVSEFNDGHTNQKQRALRVICYYWKRKMAFCLRKFYLRCFEEQEKEFSKKLFEDRLEFSHANVIQEARNELLENLVRALSFVIYKRKRDAFLILQRVDQNDVFRKMGLQRMLMIRERLELKTKISRKDLLLKGFEKLRRIKAKNKPNPLACSFLFGKLRILVKRQLRSTFSKLKLYQPPVEDTQPQGDPNLIERHIIANQAIVATYLENRLKQMDQTLLEEQRKLALKKLLNRKTMADYQSLRRNFTKLRNTVEKWRLSFKLTILKKKTELETEKEHLSKVLAQLNQMTPTNAAENDPALKYLEFIEKQNTELRKKHTLLMEIIRVKEKRNILLVP